MNRFASFVVALAVASWPVFAAEVQPSGVLSLSASANTEVTQDLLALTLAVTREGPDAGSVQGALKKALDLALTEAKKAARPGQVDVRTGHFSLHPQSDKQGRITVWQGRAELIVEGKDMQAIAQLAGRIDSMAIARVAFGLSREQRREAEAAVAGQAIARFRSRADEYARQFGYSAATVREVNVSESEPPPYAPVAMLRSRAMGDAAEALPVEAGKTQVSVTVSGSVQMSR